VCAVGVFWRFESEDAFRALGARRDFLGIVRAHVGWQLDEYAATIIFSELVANVVHHASGPVKIDLECDGTSVVLKVADAGPGFDYTPGPTPSPHEEHGRGLFIVSQYAKALNIAHTDGVGTVIVASLPAKLSIAQRQSRP
jgi:anti-sigma regulatory factor (Ser/Thr protein kinase)